MDNLCRDCAYYKHIVSEDSECHRFPPERDPVFYRGFKFAKTTFDSWCGEFSLSEKNKTGSHLTESPDSEKIEDGNSE